MADNSSFVLRWVINSATATIAAGNSQSGVFDFGGFKWKASFHRNPDDSRFTDVDITCDYEGHGEWSCKAKVDFVMGCEPYLPSKNKLTYDYGKRTWTIFSLFMFTDSIFWQYDITDKFICEFRIKILSSKLPPIVDLNKFCPNGMGNVTLVIGVKKLLVSKEYLAVHSPVLAVLFFGDFAEKGKDEVEIKDVIYEEFVDLLLLIFPGSLEITDYMVPYILKLADRFEIKHLMDKAEKHITKSKGFREVDKFLLVDQYRFANLKAHCLSSVGKAQNLKASLEFASFSDDMKKVICDRIKGIV